MCAVYCWACRDTGVRQTWSGATVCSWCVGPCEVCGDEDSTAMHRRHCRPWPAVEVGRVVVQREKTRSELRSADCPATEEEKLTDSDPASLEEVVERAYGDGFEAVVRAVREEFHVIPKSVVVRSEEENPE